MSRYILPQRKGTEIYPQQTAIPARVIVEGVNLSDASVRLIENRYMGEITTFYWRQKQKHQLSGLDVYVGREEIGDLKFTFIHLHGTDAIKVRVPEGGEITTTALPVAILCYSDPAEPMVWPGQVIANPVVIGASDGGHPYTLRVDNRYGELQGPRVVGRFYDPRAMVRDRTDAVEGVFVNYIDEGRDDVEQTFVYSQSWSRTLTTQVPAITTWSRFPNVPNEPSAAYSTFGTGAYPPTPGSLRYAADGSRLSGFDAGKFRTISGVQLTASDPFGWWDLGMGGGPDGGGTVTVTGYDWPFWAEPPTTPVQTYAEALGSISGIPGSAVVIEAPTGWNDFYGLLGIPYDPFGPSSTIQHDPYTVTVSAGGVSTLPGGALWYLRTLAPTTFRVEIVEYPTLQLDALWEAVRLGEEGAEQAIAQAVLDAQGVIVREESMTQIYYDQYLSGGNVLTPRPEYDLFDEIALLRYRIRIEARTGLGPVTPVVA